MINLTLALEVERYVSLGWGVRSQTDTSASLEDRSPFGWIWFALSLLFFFGLGGLLYILYWLLTSNEHVFLRLDGDRVIASGDAWLYDQQVRAREEGRRIAAEVKRRGFVQVMWPSILGSVAMLGIWITVLWFVFNR